MPHLATALRTTLMMGSLLALGLTSSLAARATTDQPDALTAAEDKPAPRLISQDGLEVLLYPLDRGEDGFKVITVVRADGLKPFVTETDTYRLTFGPHVSIGKLSKTDAYPSAMLQTFTGGAHCCTVVTIVTARAGQLQAIEVGTFDGGPPDTFPTDLDGDGIADFRLRDDRFLYVFASYAGSWAPPRFLNVTDGQVADVSARPGFRKQMESFAADAKAACADLDNSERNGACAAYVAVQARLGSFAQAMETVTPFVNRSEDAPLPTGCRVDAPLGGCPENQEIRFTRFEEALQWFLTRTGYIG